jgi:16S rRNA C1402 (ribose-2'-O) methylase RsmI
MKWNFFIISWIQWDYWDISKNMIKFISQTDLLFIEEIDIFKRFIIENKIYFNWELVELNKEFKIFSCKENILRYILSWKNVWIFESSWTACFIDPGYEIINYIYELRKKIDFNILPIPGTSALTLAISCSGFDIVKFQFLWFLHEKAKEEVLSSNITTIYFNKTQSLDELNKCIDFMKNLDNMQVFVWINLWKIWVKNSNKILRWNFQYVYLELNKLYNFTEKLDDLTFIFK